MPLPGTTGCRARQPPGCRVDKGLAAVVLLGCPDSTTWDAVWGPFDDDLGPQLSFTGLLALRQASSLIGHLVCLRRDREYQRRQVVHFLSTHLDRIPPILLRLHPGLYDDAASAFDVDVQVVGVPASAYPPGAWRLRRLPRRIFVVRPRSRQRRRHRRLPRCRRPRSPG